MVSSDCALLFSLILSLASVKPSYGLCKCGYGSYCKIFSRESDKDCYCSLSEGLYENESNGCNKIVNHCSKNPCKNGGICHRSFGSYWCQCSGGYGGQDCTLSVKDDAKLANEVSVLFDIHEQANGNGITFFVVLKELGDGFSLKIYNELDLHLTQSDIKFSKRNPHNVCKKRAEGIKDADSRICEIMHKSFMYRNVGEVKLRFPIVGKSHPRAMTSVEGRLIGRKDQVHLQIFNNENESFKAVYTIFTYFNEEDTKCTYSPVLFQCSETPSNPSRYSKMNKIVLRSVNKPTHGSYCYNIVDIKHTWTIRGEGYKKPFEATQTVSIEGYDLNYGKYSVEYVVDVLGSDDLGTPKKHFINFGKCWFTVDAVEVVAEVVGGYQRTHPASEPVILNGALSYDTNRQDDSKLTYEWTCEGGCDIIDKNSKIAKFVTNPNKRGEKTFELTVTSEGIASTANKAKTLIIFKSSQSLNLVIRCCRTGRITCRYWKVDEVFCLTLETVPSEDTPLRWRYRERGMGGIKPWKDIVNAEGVPRHKVIVKKNTLKQDSQYVFEVSAGEKYASIAGYQVFTGPFIKEGDCKISPSEGYTGFTEFTVECSGYEPHINKETNHHFLNYEIYELKDSNDILLVTCPNNIIPHLTLTSEEIKVTVVHVYFGGRVSKNLKVSLKEMPLSEDEVYNKIQEMHNSVEDSDISSVLSILNVLGSKLDNVSEPEELFSNLFTPISKLELKTTSDVKQAIGSTSLLLNKTQGDVKIYLSSEKARDITSFLKTSVEFLKNRDMFYSTQEEKMSFDTKDIISCVDVLVKTKDKRITEAETPPKEYAASYHEHTKLASDFLYIMEMTGDLALTTMVPSQEPLQVHGNDVTLYARVDRGERLSGNDSADPSGRNMTAVSFKNFANVNDMLEVQVTEFVENPNWFKKSSLGDVNSDHLNIKINKRDEKSKSSNMRSLVRPIQVSFKAAKVNFTGSVTQPENSLAPDEKDPFVSIHKIDRPQAGTGKLFLDFSGFGEAQLQVLLLVNEVPDYDLVRERGKVINKNEHTYESDTYSKESDDDLLYVGILPAPQQAVGGTVEYVFEVLDGVCRVWNDEDWDVNICKASKETSKDQVVCDCDHLSLVGSSLFVPPVTVDPIADLYLFRNLLDNPLLFTVVVLYFFLYISLLIWASKRDRAELWSQCMQKLEDNYPGDQYGYLLVLFTGIRIKSGTTSNIGLRLIGQKASSHAHILNHDKRNLQVGQDNWLILYSDKDLGEIEKIHIWHDNIGKNPEWYCDRLLLYDLNADVQYWVSLVGWLRVEETGPSLQLERWLVPRRYPVLPSALLAAANFFSALRETHKWFSIMIRHPRSHLTRTQRLTVIFVVTILAFMITIMFFDATSGKVEDEPAYGMGVREIIMTVELAAIGFVAANLSSYLFKFSLPTKKGTLKFAAKPDTVDEVEVKRSTMERIVAGLGFIVTAVTSFEPLRPVQVTDKPPYLSRSKTKRILLAVAWCINMLVAAVAGFLIILYGLKFGLNKSLICLSVTLTDIFSSVLITQPVFITVTTAWASLCAKRVNREQLIFEYDTKGIDPMLSKNKKFMSNLLRLRSQTMYRPLCEFDVLVIKYRIKLEDERWNKIKSFLIFLVFIILISVTLVQASLLTPFCTQNIHNIFHSEERSSVLSIKDFRENNGFVEYLITVVLGSMHVDKWYNGNLLPMDREEKTRIGNATNITDESPVKGWTGDYMNKLLGIPRLRQTRYCEDLCVKIAEEDTTKKSEQDKFKFCESYEASLPTCQDTASYGVGWDKTNEFLKWNYSSPKETRSYSYYFYPDGFISGGGYVQNLTNYKGASTLAVYLLNLNNWIDHRTKAVVMEFNLFNVHSSVFSFVTIIAGRLVGGVYSSRIVVESFYNAYFLKVFDIIIASFIAALIITLMLCTLRVILRSSLRDIYNIKSKPGNIVDVFIIIVGFICMITSSIKFLTFKGYINQFLEPVSEIFVNFSYPFRETHFANSMLCVFLGLIILRLVSLTISGNISYYLKKALGDSFAYISAILSVLVLTNTLVTSLLLHCVGQYSAALTLFFIPRMHFKTTKWDAGVPRECVYFSLIMSYVYGFLTLISMAVVILFYGKSKTSLFIDEYAQKRNHAKGITNKRKRKNDKSKKNKKKKKNEKLQT